MIKSPCFFPGSLLVILLCLVFENNLCAQTSIPFDLTQQGHILVKAKINAVEGNFIFDTGGGLTLVTKKFAEKLDELHKQDGRYTAFRATGEQLTVDLFDAQSLTMGSYEEKAPVLTIFDVNLGPIDGLISLMSFRHQPVTIDFINKRLTFESPKTLTNIYKSGRKIPLQLADDRGKSLDIFAYFEVNDKLTLQFLIDSGAGDNVYRINGSYIPALNIDTARATKTVHPSEFNAKVNTTIYRAKIHSIRAKDVPTVRCQDINASFIDGLIYDGVVSLNWIGKRITFDLEKSQMIVL